MAIFHFPPAVSTGANQPYGTKARDREESGQQVDNPPFRYGGPVAVVAAIVAMVQPNPWTYSYTGAASGAQPYGQRQLNPSITAVPANEPPYQAPGRSAQQAAIAATLTQPDPWVYGFAGRQPYEPRKLSPGIPGQSVDPPPPVSVGDTAAQNAIITSIAQPNPWVWIFNGAVAGRQPYGPRQLNATVTAVQVDTPPFDRRSAQQRATVAALTQPDPWVYNYGRGYQPYGLGLLVPFRPDSIAPDSRRAQINAAIIAAAQPNPWVYNYAGAQPYGPKQNSPGIPGQSVDFPLPDQRRAATRAAAISFQQPNPWVYSFEGAQPYAPKNNAPGIPGQSVDNPPGIGRDRATGAELINLSQPSIWPYTFIGGDQPYAPAPLDPIFEGLIEPLPGSGKRKNFPSYIPQPAYDEKPAKTFRPVWDKPRQGEVEVIEPAQPAGPPPLPPAELFGLPGVAATQDAAPGSLNLPDFSQFGAPHQHAYGQHMQDVQDLNDATALLRQLGVIPKS